MHGGKSHSDGYGVVQVEGKQRLAHRMAYINAHGLTLEDIHGKVVRHTCDNPPCVNPDHLLIGSHSDNMKDMWSRGRGVNLPPVMRGETHPQCRVSDAVVTDIRQKYLAGATRKELQAMSNLSKSQIQRIVTGSSR